MIPLARYWQELRLAGMLLTRLPMGRLADPVPKLSQARWAYPLVGLGIGALLALVAVLAQGLGFAPMLSALLVIGAGVLITGGLHEDGLADLADGFGGGHDRDRRLEIMRDSRVGSYGVLALILVLALKVQALALVLASGAIWGPILVIAVLSRFFMLAVQDVLPAARRDGMGFQAQENGGWRVWAGAGIAGTVLLVFALYSVGAAAALALVFAMLLVSVALAWQAKRLIGGQTGDVLGAVQLCAETAGWLALTLFI